jgi:hypothetical protein
MEKLKQKVTLKKVTDEEYFADASNNQATDLRVSIIEDQ